MLITGLSATMSDTGTAPVGLGLALGRRGSFSVYFTNGILATQALTHVVPQGKSGAPNPIVLHNRIDQPVTRSG